MNKMYNSKKTLDVQNFWNKNPFTYNKSSGVGNPGKPESLTLDFFKNMELRYIKHIGGATEKPGSNLAFSRYINYKKYKNKKILDIGIGTGFSSVNFAKNGAKVTAIDLTNFSIQATKRNFKLRNLAGNIKQMDAQKLDFKSNTFDYICAHGCLMHMPNTQMAISEIYRVLKPNSSGYAWMYHKGWYYFFGIIFLRGILLMQLLRFKFDIKKLTSRYTDGSSIGGNPHTTFYSENEFKKIFSLAGFKNIEVIHNYNPNEWNAWPIAKLPLGRFVSKKIQKFLSKNCGFALSSVILFKKY
jgi:ubiquinone/menaquinone biosynthesis C-methylase UbiE